MVWRRPQAHRRTHLSGIRAALGAVSNTLPPASRITMLLPAAPPKRCTWSRSRSCLWPWGVGSSRSSESHCSEPILGPAVGDLRVLALYVFLVYFSACPIGSCLVAAGRQSAWTLVQTGCVIVSPGSRSAAHTHWSQRHWGNGGIGVCAATVISEIFVVIGGSALAARGLLAKVPRAKIGRAGLRGGDGGRRDSDAGARWVLRACLALLAYALCLQITGAFDFVELRSFLGILRTR